MSSDHLTGTYLLGLEPMVVLKDQGDLVVVLTGVPPEFGARLVPEGDHFRLEGGQLGGSTVKFAEGDPSPGGTLGEVIAFTRAPTGVKNPGGRGLVLPVFNPSSQEHKAYQDLLDAIRKTHDGGLLKWNLEWPKWRFIEWLTRREVFIFHGSPNSDIEIFVPVRNSVEIMDHGGTGNLAAVYGTPFGLWAMWFAVMDRQRLQGSIQNGVMRWTDRLGQVLDLYQFSIHHELVGSDIWRSGALYLLPRESFRPIPFFPGGPDSNEWASLDELQPLKRLAIDPEDFPLLDQVGGHDDSELIHAEELGDVVTRKVNRARRIPGGLEVTLTWDHELADIMDEYLSTHQKLIPDVDRHVFESGSGEATLTVKGPEGFVQSYEKALAKRGFEVEREA